MNAPVIAVIVTVISDSKISNTVFIYFFYIAVTDALTKWIIENKFHPFPSEIEKAQFSQRFDLTPSQVR